ncbi:response regulator receiver domain-containing protein [Orenia metallireducens]|uniref:Stage 0 sporulation protein A homolog n=1 Tax=Orenia metallireducens TaxID=1413210 RepID=A0A285GQ76_9FIRM|nr:response regulator [Orenia metallireducens]PRX29912.1 response regulator receiver domain-containing protein [Orenia metallireducens]SNY25625.1 Response regulator receiver domain-containing protein [Orenia metallireducens]
MEEVKILMVEDNPGDVRLAQEILKEAKMKNTLNTVSDGEEAIKFLRKEGKYKGEERPDLVLLDWNLPKKSGYEVLEIIKKDKKLKYIPVVILTSSEADEDILKAYDLNANCYISKPVDLDQFIKVIKSIENFWMTIVKLPRGE